MPPFDSVASEVPHESVINELGMLTTAISLSLLPSVRNMRIDGLATWASGSGSGRLGTASRSAMCCPLVRSLVRTPRKPFAPGCLTSSARTFQAPAFALSPRRPGTKLALNGRHCFAGRAAAWAALHGDDRYCIERVRDGQTIFIAVDEGDHPCAYTLLEVPEADGCHVDHLYCDPDHTRRGLAAQLLARAEEFARDARAPGLYTEASELARPAFERAGYRVEHRRDFAIEHAGRSVPIHNYAMERPLA